MPHTLVERARCSRAFLDIHIMNNVRTPGAEPIREAPVSITVKGLVRGYDAMVTLRGRELPAVLHKCAAALSWFENAEALSEEDAAQVGEMATNGHVHQPASVPPRGERPYCAVHGVALRRFAKGNHVWFSHPLADGSWCKGTEG